MKVSEASSASGSMGSDLKRRVPTAIAMIVVALGATWYGSFPFLLFWTLAALIVWYEWATVIGIRHRTTVVALGFLALAVSAAFVSVHLPLGALVSISFSAVVAFIISKGDAYARLWTAGGLVYAALVFIPAALLREDFSFGFLAIIWLYAVVWLTDIAAYFAGRFIGGPKLAPAISPKKTWSGAIGGTLFGVIGGVVVAFYANQRFAFVAMLVALLVSVVAQAGDIFESYVKRRFGKKDSSGILPGHGGVMDRIDGFIFAATLALLIGLLHRGAAAPGAGLLQW